MIPHFPVLLVAVQLFLLLLKPMSPNAGPEMQTGKQTCQGYSNRIPSSRDAKFSFENARNNNYQLFTSIVTYRVSTPMSPRT